MPVQPFIPGPCGSAGCPPPTELACIKTKKVFQECSFSWIPDPVTIDLTKKGVLPVNTPLPLQGTVISCGTVFIEPTLECKKTHEHKNDAAHKLPKHRCPEVCPPTCPPIFFPGEVLRCCVDCLSHEVISVDDSFDIFYTINVGGLIITNRKTIPIPTTPRDFRRFFLSRAGEPGLRCQIEVFATCTQCFASNINNIGQITSIDCCFTFTLIGKLHSEVELLVGAYGYCPLPAECASVLATCPTVIPSGIPYPSQVPPVPPTIPPTISPTNPPCNCIVIEIPPDDPPFGM